uniref:Uncharacterized protein n=1 Tax=Anguilla anguilla TaxID=7936 RepID=A0A0E9XP68_ANGAN
MFVPNCLMETCCIALPCLNSRKMQFFLSSKVCNRIPSEKVDSGLSFSLMFASHLTCYHHSFQSFLPSAFLLTLVPFTVWKLGPLHSMFLED